MNHFYHSQNKYFKQNVCVYLKNIAHANFLDHTLLAAGEFDTHNVIERGQDPLEYMKIITLFNEIFIERHLVLKNELEGIYPDSHSLT